MSANRKKYTFASLSELKGAVYLKACVEDNPDKSFIKDWPWASRFVDHSDYYEKFMARFVFKWYKPFCRGLTLSKTKQIIHEWMTNYSSYGY